MIEYLINNLPILSIFLFIAFMVTVLNFTSPGLIGGLKIFLGPTKGKLGWYARNTNYRIRGRIARLNIDSKTLDYATCPIKQSGGRYRVNNFSYTHWDDKTWYIQEADRSIEHIRIYWNERPRRLINEKPTYTFDSLFIDFNQMDEQALKTHIKDIAQIWGLDYTKFEQWLTDEVYRFAKPQSFDFDTRNGSREFRLTLHCTDNINKSKTPFQLSITL